MSQGQVIDIMTYNSYSFTVLQFLKRKNSFRILKTRGQVSVSWTITLGVWSMFLWTEFLLPYTYKNKNDPLIWASLRGLAGSGAAKVRHLFGLCKAFGRKVWKWRWFLTDVRCFEMQNAASANQCGSSTNHSTRNSAEWCVYLLNCQNIE